MVFQFDGFLRKTIAGAPLWVWIAFHIGVFVAIGIDLFASKRRGRELSMRAGLQRTVIWLLVSLAFNALVWRIKGPHHGLDFLTAYLIEYSLSMDNIFVFVLIFAHFSRSSARTTSRFDLGNYRGADHARYDDLVRYRAGATV